MAKGDKGKHISYFDTRNRTPFARDLSSLQLSPFLSPPNLSLKRMLIGGRWLDERNVRAHQLVFRFNVDWEEVGRCQLSC